MPVAWNPSGCLSSSQSPPNASQGERAFGILGRAQVGERATMLAALYARSPATSAASSSGEGATRQRSVSRRRSQHLPEQRSGTLARSCPVTSAFAAAAEQAPFVAKGAGGACPSHNANSESDSSDW